MCCGSKVSSSLRAPKPHLSGEYTRVRYLGNRANPFSVIGAATGRRYTVQGVGTVFSADVRDLPSLLIIGGGTEFERV